MRKFFGLVLLLGLLAGVGVFLGRETSVVVASPLLGITETATKAPTATKPPAPTNTPVPSPTNAPTATPTQASHPHPAPTATTSPVIVNPIIAKVSDVTQARVGDEIQFTVFVTNPNAVAIDNVVVTDPLPAEVDFVSATTTQGTVTFDAGSHTLTAAVGTMAPGQGITIGIRVRVNASAKPPEVLTNVATVCFDGNRCTDSNAVTVTMIPGALPGAGVGPGPTEVMVMAFAVLGVILGVGLVGWLIWRRSSARG